MKWRTNYNAHTNNGGEVNTSPSKTIPDQTMSIPEILARYARGLPITQGKVPIYEGEDSPLNGTDFKKLDLSEIEKIMDENKQFIEQNKQQFEKMENEKRNKQMEQRLRKKFEDEQKEKSEPAPNTPKA